ncbi:MAG: prolyl oligopeptidase family serine peptidase [Pseudomonadota bacterium]
MKCRKSKTAALASILIAPLASAQIQTTPEVETNPASLEPADSQVLDSISMIPPFFSRDAIRFVRISPDGKRLAFMRGSDLMVGSVDEGFHAVQDWSGKVTLTQLEWMGNSALIARLILAGSWSGKPAFVALPISNENGQLLAGERSVFEAVGSILDPLPSDPDHVLFISNDVKDGNQFANVYRLNPFEKIRTQLGEADRLNKNFNRASWYVLNKSKKLFLALDSFDATPRLYKRSPGGTKWKLLWQGSANDRFIPLSLNADDSELYVLTDANSERLVAAALDVKSGQVSRIVHSDPITDVYNVVVSDRSGEPVAAVINRDGLIDYAFLDAALEEQFASIRDQLNAATVIIADIAKSDASAVIFTRTPNSTGTYHFCILASGECAEIGEVRPWLNSNNLATTETLEVASTDGHSVFAFLTLPAVPDEKKLPLIVMPHGGPIGVSDNRHYNPDAQWLAHNGYAVLRVNYRGSSGYGKTFLSAGMRQWGRGIEDDIESATDTVFSKYDQLDKTRVCIYGASYGGYSALQSIVRSPERYQCAASFAGVTDLPLLFSQSVYRRDEELRDELVKMVGDPELDLAELREYSPVYNYRRMSRPVFLAHGTEDSRVDIEHSWRLERLLRMADADVQMHEMTGVGHGFETLQQIADFYEPLMRFFDRHLRPMQ